MQCADECLGCTQEKSVKHCLGCKDQSSYLLRHVDSVDGICVDLIQCPPYKDEVGKACYYGTYCFFAYTK